MAVSSRVRRRPWRGRVEFVDGCWRRGGSRGSQHWRRRRWRRQHQLCDRDISRGWFSRLDWCRDDLLHFGVGDQLYRRRRHSICRRSDSANRDPVFRGICMVECRCGEIERWCWAHAGMDTGSVGSWAVKAAALYRTAVKSTNSGSSIGGCGDGKCRRDCANQCGDDPSFWGSSDHRSRIICFDGHANRLFCVGDHRSWIICSDCYTNRPFCVGDNKCWRDCSNQRSATFAFWDSGGHRSWIICSDGHANCFFCVGGNKWRRDNRNGNRHLICRIGLYCCRVDY